jgi:hypothetical protein
LLLVLSKDDCQISVLFEQIRNFEVLSLEMVKVIKVNIAVTYWLQTILGWAEKVCDSQTH